MSAYSYPGYSKKQLRNVAARIRGRFPGQLLDRPGVGKLAVDIERIIELEGLEIFPRPWGISVEAYVAADPKLILVNALGIGYIPRYRSTLAEEYAHKVLEFNLWSGGTLQEDHRGYSLTEDQYNRIEQDAKALAAEILEYEPAFSSRFTSHLTEAKRTISLPEKATRAAIHAVADDFFVSETSAAIRAVKLGLISATMRRRCYPTVL